MKMTPKERQAARERCEAATDGPWEFACGFVSRVNGTEIDDVIGVDSQSLSLSCSEYDGQFTAHARTDLPAVLDALDEADKKIERLKRELRRAYPRGALR